jgi:hypothetical protein
MYLHVYVLFRPPPNLASGQNLFVYDHTTLNVPNLIWVFFVDIFVWMTSLLVVVGCWSLPLPLCASKFSGVCVVKLCVPTLGDCMLVIISSQCIVPFSLMTNFHLKYTLSVWVLLLLPILRVHFLEISFSTLSSKANVSEIHYFQATDCPVLLFYLIHHYTFLDWGTGTINIQC